MHELLIPNKYGNNIAATEYIAPHSIQVLVLAAATGVRQSFYAKFAGYLAARGITVITFDYSGIGRSLHGSIRRVKASAADWGAQDLDAIIRYAMQQYPEHRCTVLGHSIGGQLIGLAPASTAVHTILLVGAQSGYWKYWRGWPRLRMWMNWHLLFPLLTRICGYFPARKISRMENLPRAMALQWSAWCRQPDYLLHTMPADKLYFERITCPLTSFTIADDRFAPPQSVIWMTGQYRSADRSMILLRPAEHGLTQIGHFGIFGEQAGKKIWPLLLRALREERAMPINLKTAKE